MWTEWVSRTNFTDLCGDYLCCGTAINCGNAKFYEIQQKTSRRSSFSNKSLFHIRDDEELEVHNGPWCKMAN